jgi:hypothetical protein
VRPSASSWPSPLRTWSARPQAPPSLLDISSII